MTPAKFAAYVRRKTRTNSTTFPDADILAFMEVRQDELAKAIVEADEDILLIPQYTSLVLNQREYPLPQDMLSSLKRVEAKLDGTNYIPLTEIDTVDIHTSIESETEITNQFNNEQYSSDNNPNGARFNLIRKALVIYSGTITSVANGLRLLVNTWPTPIGDLSSTEDMSQDPSTTTHGIPRELHEIWARGVIIDYKESKEKPIPLSEREKNYETDKIKAINALKPQNLGRSVYLSVPASTGEEY